MNVASGILAVSLVGPPARTTPSSPEGRQHSMGGVHV